MTKAKELAKKQREISVSEFFLKNRHLLGFDNPRKALLTTIKEGVDNALDACEEGEILPELFVEIKQVSDDRFLVVMEDNGPGIIRTQIPRVFAKLLYGSKFHAMKESRGQQGIGISAASMYGQLTTGKSTKIISKTGKNKPAHYFELQIDSQKNEPEIIKDEVIDWKKDQGTRIEIELEAKYQKGKQGVDEYLKQTAIANPHAQIIYISPDKTKHKFPRASDKLPKEAKEIKPHPYGVELGMLIKMMKSTKAKSVGSFLMKDFSRVSNNVVKEIGLKSGIDMRMNAGKAVKYAEKLYKVIQNTKIMNPPTNCLSPIGEDLIIKGLKKEISADFYASATRPPAVYRGNPFQVEVGIAYGGDLSKEDSIRVLRFANRVPLLYQQSAGAIFKSIVTTNWRSYGLSQSRSSLPSGPMILFVHIASVWVPFTSESKESIAHYPEIIKQFKLALQDVGRKLGVYVRKKKKAEFAAEKKNYIQKYIPHIGESLKDILSLKDADEKKVVSILKDTLERSRE